MRTPYDLRLVTRASKFRVRGTRFLGGGAECQALPPGSAANYTLKSSFPVTDGNARKWMAVWTNATNVNHPQVVQFTTCLICANK